ncbi:MAG TPA: TonB-dependent siderophore receptor [Lacunisphaera sp.]|jgi:iron complex outermembrane receptor protein
MFFRQLRAAIKQASVALLVLAASAVLAPAAEPVQKAYDIPAGDAATTLKQFVEQSGAEVVFLVNKVHGVTTNALHGEYEARVALEHMLAGTELYVVQDDKTGALVINRGPAAASPGDPKNGMVPVVHHASATAAAAEGTSSAESVVHLPKFMVSSDRDVSYVGKEAMSTTRTGIDLLDLAQSVKVINRAFIDDMSPGIIVDTLKYVGGGQAGNINFADDRFTLRGFNSPANIGDFVDGFRGTTDANTDSAIIERLEIIKGPSAIFVANGPVGGVINKVTKGPVDYDIHSFRLQVGAFDGNRAELDVGGPLTENKKILYRVVAAGQYSDGWYDRTYSHRFIFAPSLAYVFNENSRLTVKYNFSFYRYSSYNGLPFDERTGEVIDIPRQSSISEASPLNWRKDIVHRGSIEYTNRFNQYLAMRVAGFYSYNNAPRVESVYGSDIPLNYVPGTLLSRSTTAQDPVHLRRQLQADLVGTFSTGVFNHRLLVGGEWADAPDIVKGYSGTSSPIDPFNLTFPGTVTVSDTTPASDLRTNNRQLKGYVLETVSFLKDKVIVSGGVSRIVAQTSSHNFLNNTDTAPLSLGQNLKQYGVVYKVTPEVSLFYGYNENFAPNFLNGLVLPSQTGRQNEIGIKTDAFNGRLLGNVSWFDLRQENVPVPSFPQTTPPTYVLVPGETSKGFDGDITYRASKNLDILATFASFNAQASSQANTASPVIHAPVNNVAEHTYGLWTRYKFTDGELKGFSIGVGLSHLSRRAVASNNNAIIYGWLKPFTTADLVLGYETGAFRYGLNVDNLFNTRYDAAVRNQSIIVPGMGTNVKASVTWKF